MHKHFGKIIISKLTIFLFTLIGCASFLLPEMTIESCTWDKDSVSIVFSIEPDMTSFVKAFSLTEDEHPASGIFSYSGKEVRFFPSGGIKKNYDYVLTVSSSAESAKGYSLGADYCKTFSTRTDIVRPEIISFAPANGSFVTEVPDITISFSEAVARESFETAVSVSPPFSYAKIFFAGDVSVRLVPTEKLKANTLYKITISENLEDCARNALAKEFHTSFYYRHDSDSPLCAFSIKNKNGFQTDTVSGGVYSSVPKDCVIAMDFSKEMNIDSLSSYISITPTASYSIKTNAIDKTHAELVFDSPVWGKTHTFRMRKGVQAVSGNKTESDTHFDICFDAERDKPVEFVKGFLQTGTWSTGSLSDGVHYKTINGESDFSALLFDPVFFPVSSDTACTLYLVFSVSRESAGIDMFSMFDALSIAATNGCCSAVIKTFAVLSADDVSQFPVNELTAPLTDDMSIVKAGLEITNGSKPGIVTITLGDGIRDSIGNTMRAKRIFTFTK